LNNGRNKNYLEFIKTPCHCWVWRIKTSNGVIIIESKKCYRTYQMVRKAAKQVFDLVMVAGLSKHLKHNWLVRTIDD
jgi:hypothetical protein